MSGIRIFVAQKGAPRSLRAVWPALLRHHPGADFSDVWILTPHRAQIRNNRRVLLEQTPHPAFVPPHQLPLHDWLQGLLPEPFRVLTEEERFLILADLLAQPEQETLRQKFGLTQGRLSPGFARQFLQAMDDLRLWAFHRSQEELKEAVDQTLYEYPHVAERVHAVLHLLQAYRARLQEARAVDLPEALLLLLQEFRGERALQGVQHLVFQGIALVTPLEREVLRQVVEAAQEKGIAVWALVPTTRSYEEPGMLKLLAGFAGAEVHPVPQEREPVYEGRAFLTRGDEVRAVAREIKALLARNPYRIGITAPSLFEVLPTLRQAFAEYGLDFVAYSGDPLTQTPWARLWHLATHIVRAGAPTRDLQALLGSPYFRVSHRDLLLQALARVNVVQVEGLLPYLANLSDEERRGLEQFLQALQKDLEPLRQEEAQPLDLLVSALRRFLRTWTTPMPPETEAAFARALQVLTQVAGALIAPQMRPEEFLNLWQTLLQSTRLPDPDRPEPEFPLHVLGMAEAQAFEGDLLYILEATEDALPGPGPNDFLLPHRLREALGLPTQEKIARDQEFRFQVLLEAPVQRIVVAYARVDAAGNPRLPTLLADDLLANIPVIPASDIYATGALAPEETLLRTGWAAPEVLTSPALKPTREQIQAWLDLHQHEVSVTFLNRLVSDKGCGYRLYLERILQLRPPDEPSLLPYVEEGSQVHRFLRDLFEAVKRAPPEGWATEKAFLDLFARKLEEWTASYPGPPLLQSFLRERYRPLGPLLYQHLQEEQEEGLFPSALELPVRLPLREYSVVLKGRIDRVDRSSDGRRFRVIDYKTGNKSSAPKNDRLWQVWLYTALYHQQHPEADPLPPQLLYVGKREYRQMKETGTGRNVPPPQEAMQRALDQARQATEQLLNADFPPGPECRRCPFTEVCPYAV